MASTYSHEMEMAAYPEEEVPVGHHLAIEVRQVHQHLFVILELCQHDINGAIPLDRDCSQTTIWLRAVDDVTFGYAGT